ncbi:Pycsar system effector family protein [Nocardia sp. NBC_00416]|uniref:Pycsar system effector family protein n=1 Tax=Nocardia sp. NBC_00416 TaxID=2975991 RepID=UPI002E1D87B8
MWTWRSNRLPGDRAPDADDLRHAEQAWRILDHVQGLIRHAELKAVATLAAAGVLGQILVVLFRTPLPAVAAGCGVAAGAAAIVAGICSGCVLWPRTSLRGSTPNLLYFGSIASSPGLTAETYRHRLAALTRDPDELLAQVAAQVWTNSRIAHRKFRYANLAVLAVLAAAVATGSTFVASL